MHQKSCSAPLPPSPRFAQHPRPPSRARARTHTHVRTRKHTTCSLSLSVSLLLIPVEQVVADLEDGRKQVPPMPWFVRVTWFLQAIILPGSFCIFVMYWALVFNPDKFMFLSTLTHGLNFIVMLADYLVGYVNTRSVYAGCARASDAPKAAVALGAPRPLPFHLCVRACVCGVCAFFFSVLPLSTWWVH